MTAETAIQKKTPQTIDIQEQRPSRQATWTYRPYVDIFDTPDELLLIADVPGATPESIDVSVESGVLTVQAEVPSRNHVDARVVAHEYGVGNFHRRFEIDESIDEDAVTADFRDGSLTVHLPKMQKARRRRIPVTG